MTCPKNVNTDHNVGEISFDEPGIEIYFAQNTSASTAFEWYAFSPRIHADCTAEV